MASFTDQIMQSRPYVQQLPLEAMAQVGMYKQQKYEEGVQKIQSYIDNVAGLDVVRGVDKQYLQSKLNELGSKLKTVAAGDFSNFQLVNSVGGMATQIAKDPNVRNAVNSTAWYRKQQGDIETARKEGKSSKSNIWDFEQQAQAWLNGTSAGETFNGVYTPYKDVNKKVLEVIGKLHPKASSEDIAYGLKPDGTFDTSKILDAMHRKGIETVDEGQIRTAINSVLDADDLNQLAIDGRYNLRGISRESLVESARGDYDRSKIMYSEELKRQEKLLLQTTDLGKQAEINRNIKYYKDMLGDPQKGVKGVLDENYERIITSIKDDPDAAKASLYTKNYIDQIANGFAWSNIKNEILSNPVKENFWKQKNFDLEVLKEAHAETQRKFTRAIETSKELREQEKFDREKEGGGMPYWKRSGDQTTDNLMALQNYNNYNAGLQDDNNKILDDLAKKNSSINVQLSPKDILANVQKYKDNKYVPATQYEKDQMDKYITNENLLTNQKAVYETYERQALEELGAAGTIDNMLKGRGNLKVGNEIFTPKEIYAYLKKERRNDITVATAGPGPGSSTTTNFYVDDKDLSPKEKVLKAALGKRYGLKSQGGTSSRSSGNATLDAYVEGFNPLLRVASDINAKVLEKVANNLAPITGNFATEQAAVTFKDNNAKERFIASLTNVVQADLDQKTGGLRYDPKSTLETLTKKSAEEVDFQFKRQGADYYIQVTDKANPKDVQLVKVDNDFVLSNPNLGKNYLNTNLDLGQIMLRNNGTTNIFKDKAHAYFQTGKFGGYDAYGSRTVNLPVAADLENQGGQVYPVFYMQTVSGPLRYPYPQPTDVTDFQTKFLPSLTDDKIISLFKLRYPNIEQLIER